MADPFTVATYADLCKVGTGTDGWYLNASYVQTADIPCPAGENFTPIGTWDTPFMGKYDGGGHEIRDLHVDLADYGAGLFGYVKGGVDHEVAFRNISLINAVIVGDGEVGGIAGYVDGFPQSVVPTMSAPAAGFETFAVVVSGSTAASLGNHECFRMMILNHPDNTGWIWVGGSNVSAANGIPLAPGQTQELSLNNTGSVYAIAEVGSEKLIVAYLV